MLTVVTNSSRGEATQVPFATHGWDAKALDLGQGEKTCGLWQHHAQALGDGLVDGFSWESALLRFWGDEKV